MATKAQWKQPDGGGGYEVVHHETSAEMVTYDGGTVQDYLDNVPSANISTFVRGLAASEDDVGVRRALEISKDPFFDENTDNHWTLSTGPALSSDYAKFGSTSLRTIGSGYLRSNQNYTFGGADFSIACWVYATTASTAIQVFCGFGNSTTRLGVGRYNSNNFYWFSSYSGTSIIDTSSSTDYPFELNTWHHVEMCYKNSTTTAYLFFDGTLVSTKSVSQFSTAVTLPFYIGANPKNGEGNLNNAYIDELIITGKCLHTASFTPPTVQYPLDNDTIALLHFGMTKLTDSTGAIWYNHGASLSTAKKKSGSKSLYVPAGSFLQRVSKIPLGGKDFAIAGWFYVTSLGTNARFLFSHGNGDVRTGVAVSGGTGKLYWLSIFNETTYFTTFSTSTTIFPLNEWVHIELDYRNSDNKFFLFMNGEKVDEETASVFSAPQSYQFYVGSNCRSPSTYSTDGYIDEFLVTEKLLHTEDFTPSTSYSADSDTIALFNCE